MEPTTTTQAPTRKMDWRARRVLVRLEWLSPSDASYVWAAASRVIRSARHNGDDCTTVEAFEAALYALDHRFIG